MVGVIACLVSVQDVLQVPAMQEPWFLATYFLCAALSMPLWLRAVARFGLAPSWLAGMLLAVAAFAWTALLGAGDATAFLVVCAGYDRFPIGQGIEAIGVREMAELLERLA